MKLVKNNTLFIIISSLVIIIFSHPFINGVFSVGLDASYQWAINEMFTNRFSELKSLVYPIGPLGFIKYPIVIGNNFLIAFVAFVFCKFIFVISIIYASIRIEKQAIVGVFIAFLLSYTNAIDFFIIFSVLMLGIRYFESEKKMFFVLAIALSALGLLIKSYIGINSFAVLGVLLLVQFFRNRNIKMFLIDSFLMFLITYIFCLLLFGDLVYFFRYSYNVLKLAFSYSSALNLHPENNWLILSVFIVSIIAFPIFVKEKKARFVYLLMLFPLFSTWKYAMSRQDVFHNAFLLYFIIIYWSILFIYIKKTKPYLLLIPVISLLSYYINLSNIPYFNELKIDIVGVSNFNKTIVHYSKFKTECNNESQNNIKINKLPDEVLKMIGNSSVDVYPWDLSYIPANNLNWKMRNTLQSGSYSAWLDKLNADNFSLQKGADFIIFECINDCWGGTLGSLDNRYLLNDEAFSIYELFGNYKIIFKAQRYILLQKQKHSFFKPVKTICIKQYKWNEWIDLPASNNDILRAKFTCKSSFLRSLKSFIFKDELFFISYRYADGNSITYRFNPSNASEGLWINPFLQNINDSIIEEEIVQIKISNSNNKLFDSMFSIQWEKIEIDTNYSNTKNFMQYIGKTKARNIYTNISSVNEFNVKQIKYWQMDTNQINTKYSLSDKNSYMVKPIDGYSAVFSIPIDSIIDAKTFAVDARVSYLYINKPQAKFVITIDGKANPYWEAVEIAEPFGNYGIPNQWNEISIKRTFNKDNYKGGKLLVYVWNLSRDFLFIDNMKVLISSK